MIKSTLLMMALACAASDLWQKHTDVTLKVEPTGTRYLRATGHYFAWTISESEYAHIAILYTPPSGRPRLRSCGPAFANPKEWGIYEFQELVPQFNQPGRYDVRVITNLSVTSPNRPQRVRWFVFGDESLPPCRDESLLPRD